MTVSDAKGKVFLVQADGYSVTISLFIVHCTTVVHVIIITLIVLENTELCTPSSRTGILAFGPKVSPPLRKVAKSLQHNGVPYQVFSGEEVHNAVCF